MGKILGLASTIVTTNKLTYFLSAVLLGSFVMITSLSAYSVDDVTSVIKEGGPWGAFMYILESALVSPLAFTYVMIAVASLDFLGSRSRGSVISVLLPVSRLDVIKSLYLLSVISGITASVVCTYVNTILTYLVTGLKVSSYYPLLVFLTYLVTMVPTLVFITSLGMLIYSLTPIKSNISWILSIVYLVIMPVGLSMLSNVIKSRFAGEVLSSILTPGYGILRLLHASLVNTLGNALPCFIASMLSVAIVTSLAIVIFNTYAEVSV